MITAFGSLNWIAITAATLAFVVLGGVYFALLVPARYAVALGHEPSFRVKQTPLTGVGPLVATFFIVLIDALLVTALDLTGVGEAIVFGLVIAIGYLVSMTFTIAINPNFPHPIRYGLLNVPYLLVGSVVASLILVALR